MGERLIVYIERRHLFISNPSDSAVRIEIEKRLEGSINAGNIPTGTPTTPVSTPQNPPPTPPREGPLGTYHVNTLAHIPYKNEDVSTHTHSLSLI